jgi:antitoxin component YwqK of YwqJK toxin-antitoxin module
MKRTFFHLSMMVVLLSLYSCATSPETSVDAVETDVRVDQPPENEPEPVILWKPALEIFSYIDGTVDRRIEYEYDDTGKILKSVESDGRGNIVEIREYDYDGENLIGRRNLDNRGLISRTEFILNSQGLVVKEINRNSEEQIRSMVSYEYDNGKIVRSVAMNASEVPQLQSDYSYEGKILTSVEYSLPGGNIEARFERTIQNGRVMEEHTYLPDGSVETGKRFEYDGNLLIGKIYFSGNSKSKSVDFQLDDEGNIVRETWRNRNDRDFEVVDRTWLSFEIDG